VEYLRERIKSGELHDPLPGMREWSRQLGVSRRTVHEAIQQLQREGLLVMRARGARINPGTSARPSATRFVRWLYYGVGQPQISQQLDLLTSLREHLRLHDIEFTWEKCAPPRLRAMAAERDGGNELFCLVSFPAAYQKLFAAARKPVFSIGQPAPGLGLPFITADQPSIVRHATQRLLQHGHSHVALLLPNVAAPGTKLSIEAFRDACAKWPRQPVHAHEFPTALASQSLMATMHRLAQRITHRCGIVVTAPVPVGLVMTSLLQQGIAVPRQAEIISVFHSADAVRLVPPPVRYPLPVARIVKYVTDAAVRYFESGRVPRISKCVAVEAEATE
jgi:hypothetical protein